MGAIQEISHQFFHRLNDVVGASNCRSLQVGRTGTAERELHSATVYIKAACGLENKILEPEHSLSRKADEILERLTTAAEKIGITTSEKISARVFQSDDLDAFVVPDGTIFMSSALFHKLGEEDVVAGVIAHECTHMWRGHLTEALKESNRGRINLAHFLKNRFGLAAVGEIESDSILPLQVMGEAGYNPWGMVKLFSIFRQEYGERSDPSHGASLQRSLFTRQFFHQLNIPSTNVAHTPLAVELVESARELSETYERIELSSFTGFGMNSERLFQILHERLRDLPEEESVAAALLLMSKVLPDATDQLNFSRSTAEVSRNHSSSFVSFAPKAVQNLIDCAWDSLAQQAPHLNLEERALHLWIEIASQEKFPKALRTCVTSRIKPTRLATDLIALATEAIDNFERRGKFDENSASDFQNDPAVASLGLHGSRRSSSALRSCTAAWLGIDVPEEPSNERQELIRRIAVEICNSSNDKLIARAWRLSYEEFDQLVTAVEDHEGIAVAYFPKSPPNLPLRYAKHAARVLQSSSYESLEASVRCSWEFIDRISVDVLREVMRHIPDRDRFRLCTLLAAAPCLKEYGVYCGQFENLDYEKLLICKGNQITMASIIANVREVASKTNIDKLGTSVEGDRINLEERLRQLADETIKHARTYLNPRNPIDLLSLSTMCMSEMNASVLKHRAEQAIDPAVLETSQLESLIFEGQVSPFGKVFTEWETRHYAGEDYERAESIVGKHYEKQRASFGAAVGLQRAIGWEQTLKDPEEFIFGALTTSVNEKPLCASLARIQRERGLDEMYAASLDLSVLAIESWTYQEELRWVQEEWSEIEARAIADDASAQTKRLTVRALANTLYDAPESAKVLLLLDLLTNPASGILRDEDKTRALLTKFIDEWTELDPAVAENTQKALGAIMKASSIEEKAELAVAFMKDYFLLPPSERLTGNEIYTIDDHISQFNSAQQIQPRDIRYHTHVDAGNAFIVSCNFPVVPQKGAMESFVTDQQFVYSSIAHAKKAGKKLDNLFELNLADGHTNALGRRVTLFELHYQKTVNLLYDRAGSEQSESPKEREIVDETRSIFSDEKTGKAKVTEADGVKIISQAFGPAAHRAGQILPQVIPLAPRSRAITDQLYDGIAGIGQFAAYHSIKYGYLLPSGDKLLHLGAPGGGGSIGTFFPCAIAGNADVGAVKVQNRNVGLWLDQKVRTLTDAAAILSAENPDLDYYQIFAEHALPNIVRWMHADAKDPSFFYLDPAYVEAVNSWRGDKDSLAFWCPKVFDVNSDILRFQQLVNGTTLTNLKIAERTHLEKQWITRNDYQRVVRQITFLYLDQLLGINVGHRSPDQPSIVHSNPTFGNYMLPFQSEQIAIIDRDNPLIFFAEDRKCLERSLLGYFGANIRKSVPTSFMEPFVAHIVHDSENAKILGGRDSRRVAHDVLDSFSWGTTPTESIAKMLLSLRAKGFRVPLRFDILAIGLNSLRDMNERAGLDFGDTLAEYARLRRFEFIKRGAGHFLKRA